MAAAAPVGGALGIPVNAVTNAKALLAGQLPDLKAVGAAKAVAAAAAPAIAGAAAGAAPTAGIPTAPTCPKPPKITAPKTIVAHVKYAKEQAELAKDFVEKAEAAVSEGNLAFAVELAQLAEKQAKKAEAAALHAERAVNKNKRPHNPRATFLKHNRLTLIKEAKDSSTESLDKARGILSMADPSKLRNNYGVLTVMGEGYDHSFGTATANYTKAVVGGIVFGLLGIPVRILGALTGGTGGVCENRVSRTLNEWGNKGLSYGIDKYEEAGKGTPCEVAIGAIAPEHESAYRKATNSQGEVDDYDPTSIADYFQAHRSEVMVDSTYNVHYLIDASTGTMYFEDRLSNPPKYRSVGAYNKVTGEIITDPGKLLHIARAVIVMSRSKSKDVRDCLSMFNLVVLNIKNSGSNDKPNAEVTLRGFNYMRDEKTGKWQKGQLFKHGPTETFGGEAIKIEEDDAKALGRVMGMTDKEDVKGSKTSTSPSGSAATAASSAAASSSASAPVIPSAPAGMRVVPVQPDGECGFRALDMGRVAAAKKPESMAQYNKPNDFAHVTVVRKQIAEQFKAEWALLDLPGAKKAEEQKNFLAKMKVVVQTASRAKSNAFLTQLEQDIQRVIDCKRDKDGKPTTMSPKEIQSVMDRFSDTIETLNQKYGGFQADHFLLELYAAANGAAVHIHQYDESTSNWVETVAGAAFVSNGKDIYLKYSGNGGAGHYEVLLPVAAAAAPAIPGATAAAGATAAPTTTSASSDPTKGTAAATAAATT